MKSRRQITKMSATESNYTFYSCACSKKEKKKKSKQMPLVKMWMFNS